MNFNHKSYLKNTILKNLTDFYDDDEFERALSIFPKDADKSIEHLFSVLRKAIKEKFLKEHNKAERLLQSHSKGELTIREDGKGIIKVDSESDSSKQYTVSLIDYKCNCQQAKKLSQGK